MLRALPRRATGSVVDFTRLSACQKCLPGGRGSSDAHGNCAESVRCRRLWAVGGGSHHWEDGQMPTWIARHQRQWPGSASGFLGSCSSQGSILLVTGCHRNKYRGTIMGLRDPECTQFCYSLEAGEKGMDRCMGGQPELATAGPVPTGTWMMALTRHQRPHYLTECRRNGPAGPLGTFGSRDGRVMSNESRTAGSGRPWSIRQNGWLARKEAVLNGYCDGAHAERTIRELTKKMID